MPTRRMPARSFREWPLRRFCSVEIEAECDSSTGDTLLRDRLNNNWCIKYDGSLTSSYAHELNSPIVNGDNVPREINHACAVLALAGYEARSTCGLHVHVDCTDLTSPELHNLARLNITLQDALNRHVPRNRYTANWAHSSQYDFDTINRLPSDLAVEETRRELTYASGGRYRGFNMSALTKFGSIEFRHMEGSVDADDILAWTYIVTSFIEHGRHVNKVLKARRLRDKVAQLWAICQLPSHIRDWSYMRMVRFSPLIRNYRAAPRIRVVNEEHGFPVVYGVQTEDVPQARRIEGAYMYGHPQYRYEIVR